MTQLTETLVTSSVCEYGDTMMNDLSFETIFCKNDVFLALFRATQAQGTGLYHL